MRILLGLSSVLAIALAAPALALTTSPPPSPVMASPMHFADPDAALEQTGSSLQQGFVGSTLGLRGSGGAQWGDATPFTGSIGDGDGFLPLRAPTNVDVGRGALLRSPASATPR